MIWYTKIYYGGAKMNVAIYVHHGLADGYHIAKYLKLFQSLLDGDEIANWEWNIKINQYDEN